MTKKDLKFIVALVVAAAICLGGWLIYSSMHKDEGALCDIYYHSDVVHTMAYNKDEIYEIDGDYGHMVIEMKDGLVCVKEVECPNHICEYMGKVEQGTFISIYCVPNDIIIMERHTK